MAIFTCNKTAEQYKWPQRHQAAWPQKGHCMKPSLWLPDPKGGRDYLHFLERFRWWEYVWHKVLTVKVFNSYTPKLVMVSKYLQSEFMRGGNKTMREKFLHERKKNSVTSRDEAASTNYSGHSELEQVNGDLYQYECLRHMYVLFCWFI